jgi:VWFA-related protein
MPRALGLAASSGLVWLSLTALALHAAPQQAAPVFRASTDYVRLDAVVTDNNGKPMSDLSAADFQVTDAGRPQTVADARFVSIPVQHRKLDLDQPVMTEPDVATNAPPKPDSRAFVLIVDDLHLIPIMITSVQRVMTEFIETLSADDEVAILFAGHSDLSLNFTSDPAKMLKAIRNVKAAFGFGIGVAGPLQVEELPYDRDVVWQIRNVAEALAHSTHARRAIVFVGAFSQFNPAAELGTTERGQVEMLQRFIDDAWDAARKADVPIYTIDPRGIPDDWNSASVSRPNVAPDNSESLNAAAPQSLRSASAGRRARWTYQQDHLAEMAVNTGGQFYINRSNLIGAVDEMMADNGSFYELGYYPSPAPHDGQFHQIRVAVKRPGAHVRVTKNGYLAAAAGPAGSTTMGDTLNAALGDGLNVSGLSLRASVAPMAPTKKTVPTVVTLELSYALPSDSTASFADDVQVTVLGLDPDGKVKSSSTRPWHLSGPAPASGTLAYVVDDVIELPAEPLTLRIGAISRLAGRAGTVQLSVDPPGSSGRLQLSGVLLGIVNHQAPLVLGGETLKAIVPFQPTTSRTFAQRDEVRVFGDISWGAKDETAAATISIAGAASPVVVHATVNGVRDAQGHRAGVLDATLPLSGLASGNYVMNITVELSAREHVTRAIPISVK